MTTEQLVAKLTEASDAYYNTGEAIMTDGEFDILRERLQELDPDNEFLKKVGARVQGSVVKHPIPMGSQEKLKTKDEFVSWMKNMLKETEGATPFVLEEKLDGITLAVYYKDGKLTQAVTRGDGFEGEDITANVLKMSNVKKTVPGNFTGVLRAEVMLSIPDFEKYFKPAGYKNPRNTVAGMSRDLKGNPLVKHFQPTYFMMATFGPNPNSTIVETNDEMKEWGLKTARMIPISREEQTGGGQLSDDEYCESIWIEYQKIAAERASLDHEIDGVILKVNDLATNAGMGMSSDLRPKAERCIKFEAMGATTKLLSVELSIGHTGAIIPTGKVAPVEIGGVTVTSVLLNNYEEIERLGVAINDDVRVIRAGDVIPKVVAVVRRAADRIPLSPPTECIACGGTIVKDGAHVFCQNEDCEGKAIRRIKTWIGKRNIKFLGDELLIELFENHNIKEPQDIYGLTEEYLSKVKRGKGVVGSSAKQIMAEVEKSKECPLNEFMGSLAVKFMGRRQAEILIKGGMDTLEKFLTGTPEDFAKALGNELGTKATELPLGIKKARKTVLALIEAGIKISEPSKEEAAPVEGGKLAGYAVCFTGVRPKPEEEAQFKSLGGTVKDGVSKNTTHLVVKDVNSTSNKTTKAKELGVAVVGYAEFQKWLS